MPAHGRLAVSGSSESGDQIGPRGPTDVPRGRAKRLPYVLIADWMTGDRLFRIGPVNSPRPFLTVSISPSAVESSTQGHASDACEVVAIARSALVAPEPQPQDSRVAVYFCGEPSQS